MNSEKLFSLFETHTQLYRRGKAGQGDEHGLQIELPGGALARLGRDASDQEQCRLIRNVVQTLREVTS